MCTSADVTSHDQSSDQWKWQVIIGWKRRIILMGIKQRKQSSCKFSKDETIIFILLNTDKEKQFMLSINTPGRRKVSPGVYR